MIPMFRICNMIVNQNDMMVLLQFFSLQNGSKPSPSIEATRKIPMKTKRITGSILFAVLVPCILLDTIVNKIIGHQSTFQYKTMAQAFSTNASRPVRLLCFGDSLTAGSVPLASRSFPYAPHLETALAERNLLPNAEVAVRHMGFPGRTASTLLQEVNGENGLGTLIRKVQNPSLSLIIILAGTNDLGQLKPAKDIAASVISLHQYCYGQHIPRTIVIGIPPSNYQSIDQETADKALEINARLRAFCESEPRAVFFPFPFEYENDGDNWSFDGLHFSSKGYKMLGESLEPLVTEILSSDELL